MTDVTDESGMQQLAVTDALHRVRMDRHGIPLDEPQPVDWSTTIAPAFQQRKVVSMMEDARVQANPAPRTRAPSMHASTLSSTRS